MIEYGRMRYFTSEKNKVFDINADEFMTGKKRNA